MATSKRKGPTRAQKLEAKLEAERAAVDALSPIDLVDACLATVPPAPYEIRPPELVVQRLAGEFAALSPDLRVRAIPVLAREYGWLFAWPTLSQAEADAFAATPTRLLPGDRAFLFGDDDATTAGDLETFRRCLAIASAAVTLDDERRTTDELRAAVPVMSPGPEEARILGTLLEVRRGHECGTHLRQMISAFLFRNERWHVFDQLAEGYAQGRATPSEYDLLGSSMCSQPERVEALRERWRDAKARGQEHMKRVWAAQLEVEQLAFTRLTDHPDVQRRLGTKLMFAGLPVADNIDPSSIAISFTLTNSKTRAQLGTVDVRAKRVAGEWTFEVLRVRGGDVDLDVLGRATSTAGA